MYIIFDRSTFQKNDLDKIYLFFLVESKYVVFYRRFIKNYKVTPRSKGERN